ncbi:MAG: hypothetical protein KME20_14915 [Kaiparowitsia implicata GSE-PSE-MK54-09C]|nr:hypothetical protein [Kaiparowitsia implicata GSE-PSE-MK54-09C]
MTESKAASAESADKATSSTSASSQKGKEKESEVSAITVKDSTTERERITGPGRPVGPGAIEIAESYSSAGVRPIAASHLDIYGTILNGRPIMSSDIRVLDTTMPGHRPVFSSNISVREDLSLPGGRPIFSSDAELMEAPLLPGGRPIATNETADSETLMGYLD